MCHQCDFNEAKIDLKLAHYATDSKYKGLEEFEWQTTQTRADKEAEKRRKQEIAERKRIQRERAAEMQERR